MDMPSLSLHSYVEAKNSGRDWAVGIEVRAAVKNGTQYDTLVDCVSQSLVPPNAREMVESHVFKSQERKSRALLSRGLDLAKEWLTFCCEEHQGCGGNPPQHRICPSRLIKIHRDDGTRKVRLVEHADVRPSSPYFTLSHRWGQEKICKLKQDNLERYRNDIPLCDLSNTFQDAIEVTDILGFEYIWIDS
jgi:hypothetical protein